MKLDWDEAKNRRNLKKHGVDFETASLVFEDPYALAFFDCIVEEEERWQTIGAIHGLVVLLVAHTSTEDLIRIISARKATPQERRAYEQAY